MWKVAAVVALVLALGSAYQFVKGGKNVVPMQSIYVPAGQRVNITLSDGTNVWLNARTRMLYPAVFDGPVRQVTIDGETMELERPFFVIATQNPVETAGTFPLPEAQTDRFMMKLAMGFPDREEETAILQAYSTEDPLERLQPVMTKEELLSMKEEAKQVYVHPLVAGYLADIAGATRKQEKVAMGVSPRGTLALMRAAKALACMEGRDYLIPDDVKALAVDVLSHRLIFAYGSSRQEEARALMEEILAQVNVPVEDFGKRG